MRFYSLIILHSFHDLKWTHFPHLPTRSWSFEIPSGGSSHHKIMSGYGRRNKKWAEGIMRKMRKNIWQTQRTGTLSRLVWPSTSVSRSAPQTHSLHVSSTLSVSNLLSLTPTFSTYHRSKPDKTPDSHSHSLRGLLTVLRCTHCGYVCVCVCSALLCLPFFYCGHQIFFPFSDFIYCCSSGKSGFHYNKSGNRAQTAQSCVCTKALLHTPSVSVPVFCPKIQFPNLLYDYRLTPV